MVPRRGLVAIPSKYLILLAVLIRPASCCAPVLCLGQAKASGRNGALRRLKNALYFRMLSISKTCIEMGQAIFA